MLFEYSVSAYVDMINKIKSEAANIKVRPMSNNMTV